MLVMLAPIFDGSAESYAKLARATGMVVYDLKSRVKPGVWGIVRALADEGQAAELARRLRADGFPAFVVPREVAHDTNRRIVTIRALEIRETALVLHLREREMPIPFGALTCIVRGEVHWGHVPARSMNPSSATFRAVVPSASDVQVFRESLSASNFEAFAAADLHFATVLWVARIDARSFDFSALGEQSESPAADLDRLVDALAVRVNVRVDRGVRSSSVVSVLMQAPGQRSITPPSSPASASQPSRSQSARAKETPSDQRFDPYSRVIAEAERLLAQAHKPG
jgi:hypothetical protein